ncbi:hypothetical protein ACQY0O_008240 [Thecaphora frezii]
MLVTHRPPLSLLSASGPRLSFDWSDALAPLDFAPTLQPALGFETPASSSPPTLGSIHLDTVPPHGIAPPFLPEPARVDMATVPWSDSRESLSYHSLSPKSTLTKQSTSTTWLSQLESASTNSLIAEGDVENLRSSFNDSDDEDKHSGSHLVSRVKLVGMLMRPKPKEHLSNTSSKRHNRQPSSASLPEQQRQEAAISESFLSFYGSKPVKEGSHRRDSAAAAAQCSAVEIEESIASFFGTVKPKSKPRSNPQSNSSKPGKEAIILSQALCLGAARKPSVPESSPWRATDATHSPKLDDSASLRVRKESDVARPGKVVTPASSVQVVSPPASLHRQASALASATTPPDTASLTILAQRSAVRPSRETSPVILPYDRARRPVSKSHQEIRAELTSCATAAPRPWLSEEPCQPSPSWRHSSNVEQGHLATSSTNSLNATVYTTASSSSAQPLQQRARKGLARGPLPPVKPPPGSALPPVPDAFQPLGPGSHRAARSAAIDHARTIVEQARVAQGKPAHIKSVDPLPLALPPFKAVVTQTRLNQVPLLEARSAMSSILIELNVGGQKFTTSSATLCGGNGTRSRLANFICEEIDRALRDVSGPSSTGFSAPHRSTLPRERSRSKLVADGASPESDPDRCSTMSPHDSTSSCVSDQSDCFSHSLSTSTLLSSEDDLDNASGGRESASKSGAEVVAGEKSSASFSFGLTSALDGLLAEQQAYLDELQGNRSANEKRDTLLARRASNTNGFCPNDVIEDDEDNEGFGELANLFPSPTLRHMSKFDAGRGTDASTAAPSLRTIDSTSDKSPMQAATIMFTAVSPTTPGAEPRREAGSAASQRKPRAAFSLQPVPRSRASQRVSFSSSITPNTTTSSSSSSAASAVASVTVVSFLSLFLDRNPKTYAALLDTLRDCQLPTKFHAVEDDEYVDTSSMLSWSSSSEDQSGTEGAEKSFFRLASVHQVKRKKTLARLADLKREAAWLGYDAVVQLCIVQEKKASGRMT